MQTSKRQERNYPNRPIVQKPVKLKQTDGENITLTFVGPSSKRETAKERLKKLNFTPSDTPAWKAVLYDIAAKQNPGRVLYVARAIKGLTQGEVAEQTKIHRRYISEIENGVRRVSAKRSKKLAKVFKIEAELFLSPK